MIFLNYIVYYRHGANWAATKVSKSNINVLLRYDKLFFIKTLESALRLICLHFGRNALPLQKIQSAQKIF